jgi:hypothetical protein
MVHVNPWERLTANEYLHNSKGCGCGRGWFWVVGWVGCVVDILFPREMYSFLVKYCKLFANQPVLTSDEKIARLVCGQGRWATNGETDKQMDRHVDRQINS